MARGKTGALLTSPISNCRGTGRWGPSGECCTDCLVRLHSFADPDSGVAFVYTRRRFGFPSGSPVAPRTTG